MARGFPPGNLRFHSTAGLRTCWPPEQPRPTGPFPNTGRAFRRTSSGALVPYYDRGEIEDGALDEQHLEISWMRSTAEALFIQIEGSARIRLEDGTMLRANYDAHNGYPFVPIGRALIDRRLIPREEMSMQRIREWLRDHPDESKDVRRQNRSVVFFRTEHSFVGRGPAPGSSSPREEFRVGGLTILNAEHWLGKYRFLCAAELEQF
jgi:membrane-bound lytic murein transglycosylase A